MVYKMSFNKLLSITKLLVSCAFNLFCVKYNMYYYLSLSKVCLPSYMCSLLLFNFNILYCRYIFVGIRDWFLIMGRGATKWGN